ncbi:MAG: hypothetical protein R3F56_08950 [Planctomycetota bacterium]
MAAALVAAALLLQWLFARRRDTARPAAPAAGGTMAAAPTGGNDANVVGAWVEAFQHAVAAGFEVPSCCDPGTDLPTHCREAFASAVDVAASGGVKLCGAYCGGLAGDAVGLLALSDGDPVCLFVLPKGRAPAVGQERHGDVRVRRRDLGRLAVFEVSRLADPHLLPLVFEPEQ